MRLGIGSYTYTWAIGVPGHPPAKPLQPLDLLRRAKELGVGVVQFCENLPLVRCTPAELEDSARFARDHGISLEIGTRGLEPQDFLLHHILASEFGSPILRLVIDSQHWQPSPEETIAWLRQQIPFSIGKEGVKLAIENHDRFDTHTLVRIIKELGPDQVGICLDTVNSFGSLEGPEAVVKALAPYVLCLHIKDFTIERVKSQMGFVISGCPVGKGRLDVPWLLEEIRAAGRDPNAIVELWTPFGATLEETIGRERAWAEESVRYLRRFISD